MSAPVATPEKAALTAGTVEPAHAYCTLCTPFGSEVGTSLCGYTGLCDLPAPNLVRPSDACVVCVDLWTKPCGRCGS